MSDSPNIPPSTPDQRRDPGSSDWSHSAFFRAYAPRIEALVRGRLSPRFQARFDADDVVQSAFRSFFLGRPDPTIPLNRDDDLWPLLAEIAVRKLAQQIRRHQAQCRDVRVDLQFEEGAKSQPTTRTDETEVSEVVALMQAGLDETAARVFKLRLEGYEILEIAETVQVSERTVRRQLDLVKARLIQLLDHEAAFDLLLPQDTNEYSLQFSDYRLHQWIGDGATGNVYRASEKTSGRAVAIKFLKKQFLFHAQPVAAFLREVQVVSTLQHPGILPIHGLGRTPNRSYFLVMDWAPYGDLAGYLKGRVPNLKCILSWAYELVDALAHSHQRGIIHCDLKPSNVLIGNSGELKLCDFGLAHRIVARNDPSFAHGGTPAFIAPELLDPSLGQIGTATDVFGLGAVIYQLLTGQAPHEGQSVAAILHRAVNPVPVGWPAAENRRIPANWRAFCDRLLAKRVADRSADMETVRDGLMKLSETQAQWAGD